MIVQGFQAGVMSSQSLQVSWGRGVTPFLAESTGQKGSISRAARLALSLGVQSLSFDEQSTSFSASADGVQLEASSRTNVESQHEEIVFDIEITADQMGLDQAQIKAMGGKPFQFEFRFEQDQVAFLKTFKLETGQTIKPAQEILTDLSKALAKVVLRKGLQTVEYSLDDEAVQSLIGSDKKLAEAWSSLILLMAEVNLASREQPHEAFVIYLSGKGQPYMKVEQSTDIKQEQISVQLRVKIVPPGSATERPSDTLAEKGEAQ